MALVIHMALQAHPVCLGGQPFVAGKVGGPSPGPVHGGKQRGQRGVQPGHALMQQQNLPGQLAVAGVVLPRGQQQFAAGAQQGVTRGGAGVVVG
ncbi:hypothetical protein [Nitratidesulfovibrio liaohensis]|uniref:Uncharacterized protein n=1 Tax=Nitratidesulfovibrio liaohensis TaxID=2604158 RepID=A0ABY9R6Y0_9BACT|nr:hypothetical protein [Nitratidesulfovibrio liaohensis]WMW67382.1 hypothetical protein KPS_002173 [Nitratidesulfovibrio liaohensis]